ncbi:outer membrane beta-barrel protein [Bdellovibrio sp. HCB337]|uniref:outer membrane beta-barrel protein n=1 Tax=Bdellovibrio sp. HCB337 TaxID=3394358 RepID=UPI0039A535B9
MFKSAFQKSALLITATMTLVSFSASAQFMGIEVGIRQQTATAEAAGVKTSTEMAYQFGLVGAFPMTENLSFRSGFLYTQRPITAEQASVKTKYTFNYFDIPLTILWKLNDFGGVYGGVNMALAASADCDNCGVSVEKTGAMPLVIGGTFKFAPNFGVDVYFEAMNKFNDDFKEGRAVGANLLITFD